MQRLKGLSVLIPFILSGIMILTGCGQEEASGGVTDVTDALFLSEKEAEETGSTMTVSGETATTAPVSEIRGRMQGTAELYKRYRKLRFPSLGL